MKQLGLFFIIALCLPVFGQNPEQQIFSWVVGHQNYRGPSQKINEFVVLENGQESVNKKPCILRIEAHDVVDRSRVRFVFASLYLPPTTGGLIGWSKFYGAGMFFEMFDGGKSLTIPSKFHDLSIPAGTVLALDILAEDGHYGFSEVFLVRPPNYEALVSRTPESLTKDVRIEWITDDIIGSVREVRVFDLGSSSPKEPVVLCRFPEASSPL